MKKKLKKKIPALLVCVLLLAGAASGQAAAKKRRTGAPAQAAPPAAAQATSGDELRKRLQQVMNAWSTMDPDNAAKYYAKDADLVFFDVTPLQYRGWDEYYVGVKKLFANYQEFNLRLRDDAQVHFRGDFAYATAIWDAYGTLKDGAKQELPLRWTVILERRNGDWMVVHEHVSAPLPEPGPSPSKPQAPQEDEKKKDPYK